MSTPTNANIFEQSQLRVIAAGFDTERWLNDGQAVGTEGIANPQPTRLHAARGGAPDACAAYAWMRVDLQMRALLREPLRAYTGLGKPEQGAYKWADRGTRRIPTQQVVVRQFYLPGLYVQGHGIPLYESVFAQPIEVSAMA